jgi:uncharacterized protein YvpB
MKINVPYFSQISDVVESSWQSSACSIVNLKMVLEFLSPGEAPSINELIAEGVVIGAYSEGAGWSHDGIVRLFRNHGVPAYAQEFRSVAIDPATWGKKASDTLVETGIEKLAHAVSNGKPVIVSVLPGFGSNSGNHTVTLVGADEQTFFYHDPHAADASAGKCQSVPKQDFKKFWRHLAIFVD